VLPNSPTPEDRRDADRTTDPRRVLVTGGAGFIGSHLVDLLVSRGDRVTVIDDLSTGRRANLAGAQASGRLRVIEGDLGAVISALPEHERFDEIYHLAAAVGVQLVMNEPILAIETNVEHTARMLRFALSRSPAGGPTPILIASSSEVYGKGTRSPFAEDDDVLYGPTTITRWSYACSKAIDEFLALAHARQNALPVVVARFFNTVGPRQVGDYGMVLPRFVEAALTGRDLEVHGDGTQSRCFCDVRDVAGVLPTLLGAASCRGRVFNIGSDRVISIRELADLVVRQTSSASRVRLVPYTQAFPPGFEDLAMRRPDLTRIRAAVGFEPRIPLDRTVRDLADQMRAEQPPGSDRSGGSIGSGVIGVRG
jgi:UDP-glucose 4-epimerase